MSKKAKNPEVVEKKIPHKPIDYVQLNRLSEDFKTRFTPQQELSAEQAFWFRILNPTIKPSYSPPVIVDVPSELPKVSLVNASLKKLKFHLAQFDSVVKKRTTPSISEEGEWGFEHTKAVFNKEIIPFLKSLKDIFNVFDKDLLNEITKVQIVFDQIEEAVQQSLVDKQCVKIMSQDVMITMLNSMSVDNDSVNMELCESCDKKTLYFSCINQNALEIPEYFEMNDLKAQLQDKDTTICKLKDIIRSMSDKSKDENVNTDLCELAAKNVELENIEQAKEKQPLDSELDFACKYATRIQELLLYVHDTCPNTIKPSVKKVVVAPLNKAKKVRFAEPLTSSNNTKQVESFKTSDSNTPVLSSTGVKCSTSNCGSKPPGNKKNDRISQKPSRNMENKVEAQPRKVNNKNRVVEPICDDDVKHSCNTNSAVLCGTCNKSMFDGVHDKCLLDFVKNGNNRAKSTKKHKTKNVCKTTGYVFTDVGYKWKPTGRTFTIVGNSCPLTRITFTNVVPPNQTNTHSVEVPKPELKVYSRKPKSSKNIGSSKIAKIIESKNANYSEPNHTWGSNATNSPSCSSLVMQGCPDSTVRFGNDQIASIMGYDDYQLGNVVISRVYYVEEFGHNLDTKLYTISLNDMLKSTPICLLSKASKTKSWLWHRRLSHLNFGDLNKLAKDGLLRGLPRLKFQKDHMCSACALGKSKKSSHKPKVEDTNHEKLYLLHMDLCGPMRVASINDLGKFDAKADIGIFVGYAPSKKAFRIYNKRTRLITETIHVTFDELTAMASKQFNSGPGLHYIIPATPSTRLDSPSTSIPSSQEQEHSPIISQGFEESPIVHDDPLKESPIEDSTSPGSSSNMIQPHTPSEHTSKWTKDHPLENIIGELGRPVSTRLQLHEQTLFCYYDAFLTSVEPKSYKEALTHSCWIEAMQ
ncbi:retrovirus-related pol polyprotein from transposon TNT 1-94 [Tanacetum coccineum]|uniref:Retrovirus-related pol polyprotein from transposon TNT 1-94 n=1 Tax=Tanacetum coccineum TaxID=301880 RepID=A0ABQ4ZJ22_9ASTR